MNKTIKIKLEVREVPDGESACDACIFRGAYCTQFADDSPLNCMRYDYMDNGKIITHAFQLDSTNKDKESQS